MTTVLTEGSSSNQDQFSCCIKTWHEQQENDLEDLLQGLRGDTQDTQKLVLLAQTHVNHIQDHYKERALLAQVDATFFFSPTCCSTFENSYMWLAGSRPSQLIRLVYILWASKFESQLQAILQGEGKGDLGDLSTSQVVLLNQLQQKTIADEDRLSTVMASLQKERADQPLALLAYAANHPGEANETVDQAINTSAHALVNILEQADTMRMNTLTDIIKILTPLQAVDFLAANIKLHLSVNKWGSRRDDQLKADNRHIAETSNI